MSIIHEALKKVQSNRTESKILKDPPIASFVPDAAVVSKNSSNVTNTVLWCILIVAVSGFTFYNLY